jgi:hypothetical protein
MRMVLTRRVLASTWLTSFKLISHVIPKKMKADYLLNNFLEIAPEISFFIIISYPQTDI